MKKTLSLIFCIILFISGFNEFICISGNNILHNYSVVGFYVAITSSIFYIYSLYTSKKDISIVSSIGLIIGFIMSMITLYSAYKNNISITLGIGFYLLLISYVIYIISLFISNEVEDKEECINTPNDKQYIRGKYILGITSNEQLSNCECLLTVEGNMLHIVIAKDNKTVNYDIDINSIENIDVKKVMLMNQNNNNKVEDHTVANQVLFATLFGPYGSLVYQTGIFNDSGKDTKVSYQYVYETEITYKLDNDKKRIILQLYQELNKLFMNIKK